jgi:hypothetical protein
MHRAPVNNIPAAATAPALLAAPASARTAGTPSLAAPASARTAGTPSLAAPASARIAVALISTFGLAALLATATALLSAPAHAVPPEGTRDFYGALDDTLGDFEYDLKHDNVKGIESFAIREISASENVPRSFLPHIEDLITERVLRATKVKVIKCIGCQARSASLVNGDRITMTSPKTNAKELAQIASAQGIKHFMDVSFTFQPTGLLMSMTIAEPSGSVINWSHTYNSETSKAALLRRGYDAELVDPTQRKSTEYPAVLQYRLRVDYLVEPDISGYSGVLGFAFRMVERYDNRKKEIGYEIQYLRGAATLLHASATDPVSLYSGINATLLVLHAWNLLNGYEDLNLPRASFYGGIGGTFTAGFLGALFRAGGEYRMGQHSAVTAHLGYRPSSTSFIPIGDGQSVSGLEAGAGISFLF